ncbi:DUF3307 domain-containing protein [Paracoccus sp. IB05]|uniref:DUF3307 domain-containing protein n=1 Tax=Paracoccus sp. IB05 TaxID=2779367 RepID=UPI0018E8EAC8|nr:DUF3307 domain-containing protein [Paracoccus sp. IB05]MBJ2150650.1 DUF3307 domain-containing protein [Paracoccus sp. IB05]
MMEILALLIVGHMLADYPLQGDFLARGKNRTAPIPGVPWQHPLAAHSIIHGGFVGIITGTIWLGLAEAVVHWFIDDAKCRGLISYHADQALHIGCKVLWVAILAQIGGAA